jgi:hypothetical protein
MTQKPESNVSDDMLMALADGELTGPDASKLLAQIKANPELSARYAMFTTTAAALRDALDPGPVPDHLISTVLTAPMGSVPEQGQDATVIPLRAGGKAAPKWSVWPMALAASLALAMGIGGFLTGRGMAPVPAGLETAAIALTGTTTGGSTMLADGSTARVLGSFDTDIGLCRLIVVDGADGHMDRAVLCRSEPGAWRTALAVSEGSSNMFLPASDMAVGLIDDFLTGIGASAAMPPEDEARALSR